MKPFLSGRTQVQSSHLQPISGFSAAQAVAKAGEHKHAGPSATVETIKEGDKVVRLIVTCACGERIEIDCLYPANG